MKSSRTVTYTEIDFDRVFRSLMDPPEYPAIPPAGLVPAPPIGLFACILPVFYGGKVEGCPP